jgi:hypothetical protein
MASRDRRDSPPPPAAPAIPAATQGAVTRFVPYLMAERLLSRATQTLRGVSAG